MAVVHGARAGTAAGNAAYVPGSTAAVLLVAFLTAYRLVGVWTSRRGTPIVRARAASASGVPAPLPAQGATGDPTTVGADLGDRSAGR